MADFVAAARGLGLACSRGVVSGGIGCAQGARSSDSSDRGNSSESSRRVSRSNRPDAIGRARRSRAPRACGCGTCRQSWSCSSRPSCAVVPRRPGPSSSCPVCLLCRSRYCCWRCCRRQCFPSGSSLDPAAYRSRLKRCAASACARISMTCPLVSLICWSAFKTSGFCRSAI